jgi:hypothetical protein
VHYPALGGKNVLAPNLLNVYQSALPGAVHKMLQGGELN